MPAAQAEDILISLKKAASALRDAGVPFALGGGLAAWARGGPPTEKDVDLLIRGTDSDTALAALGARGFRTEVPPEGWLVKAYDEDVLIDLIYAPAGFVVDDALLARCDELNVHAVPMRVLRVEDLLASKLLSLTEHHLDYGPALETARALREQVDWDSLWERVNGSPFARAFFCLARELGVVHPPPAGTVPPSPERADLQPAGAGEIPTA